MDTEELKAQQRAFAQMLAKDLVPSTVGAAVLTLVDRGAVVSVESIIATLQARMKKFAGPPGKEHAPKDQSYVAAEVAIARLSAPEGGA